MPEFLQLFLRNARADLAAVELYAPEPERAKSRFPMTAFSGPATRRLAGHDVALGAGDGAKLPPPAVRGRAFYFLGSAFAKLAHAIVADVEQFGFGNDIKIAYGLDFPPGRAPIAIPHRSENAMSSRAIETTIDIAAPAERVWRVFTDFASFRSGALS